MTVALGLGRLSCFLRLSRSGGCSKQDSTLPTEKTKSARFGQPISSSGSSQACKSDALVTGTSVAGPENDRSSLSSPSATDNTSTSSRTSDTVLDLEPSEEESSSVSRLGPFFYPIAPEEYERYDRKNVVPNEYVPHKIQGGSFDFFRLQSAGDWQRCMHPEGAQYFSRAHSLFTIYTDGDLFDDKTRSDAEDFVNEAASFIQQQSWSHHFSQNKIDFVLDITPNDEGGRVCGYYFACRDRRTVVWLDNFDAFSRIWYNIKGVDSNVVAGHGLEAQYWYHCALFPCDRPPSTQLVTEIRDILQHAIGDRVMSTKSTIPYTIEDLKTFLGIVEIPESDDSTRPGLSRIIYQLLEYFARERLYHFHGHPAARLNRGDSIYDKDNRQRPHILIRGLCFLLMFNAPIRHLEELRNVLSDDLICNNSWKTFAAKLTREWEQVTIFSTVLLNANMAFLSINTVDDTGVQAPVKIAAYLSVVSSLGSVLFGLLLLQQKNNLGIVTSEQAKAFLGRFSNQSNGYGTVAFIYSLPYVLLFWGMLGFVSAFVILSIWMDGPSTRIILGIAWGLLFGLVICYVLLYNMCPSISSLEDWILAAPRALARRLSSRPESCIDRSKNV